MKYWSVITIISLIILVVLFSGCSSPVNSPNIVNDDPPEDDPPEDDPPINVSPWPVTGPTTWQVLNEDDTFLLEVSDFSDPRNVYESPGPFDPNDGDTVSFEAIFVSMVPEHPTDPTFVPEATVDNGIFSMVWDSIYDGSGYQITFMIKTSDGTDETLSESNIRVIVN